MAFWNDDYGMMVCSICNMPSESNHPTIYDCVLALGIEVARLHDINHRKTLVELDNPPWRKVK